MSNIYFAKVNINSEIYDVYKNPTIADDILNELFVSINQDIKVQVSDGEWVKFIHIDKDFDKRFIAGRLVKVFTADIEIYDSKQDDVSPIPTQELAKSVTFFFDLRSEIVAFTTAQMLGRKKFVEYFNELINAYSSKATFEVFLKSNSDIFIDQIRELENISKIDLILVPPNINEDEFHDLFPQNGDEIIATHATKIRQSFSTGKRNEGLNIDSPFFKRVIEGVSHGFGKIFIHGKHRDGKNRTLTNEENAPQKRFIPNDSKESIPEIKERGKAGIIEILANEHSIGS